MSRQRTSSHWKFCSRILLPPPTHSAAPTAGPRPRRDGGFAEDSPAAAEAAGAPSSSSSSSHVIWAEKKVGGITASASATPWMPPDAEGAAAEAEAAANSAACSFPWSSEGLLRPSPSPPRKVGESMVERERQRETEERALDPFLEEVEALEALKVEFFFSPSKEVVSEGKRDGLFTLQNILLSLHLPPARLSSPFPCRSPLSDARQQRRRP